MKMNSRCIKFFIFVAINCVFYNYASAQKADVEYLGAESPATWTPMAVGEKPDSVSVWIQGGTTVTLDEAATFKSMLIDAGATLNSTVDAKSDFINRLTAVAPNSIILNNGTLGATGAAASGISLVISSATRTFTLMGDGKTAVASLLTFKNTGLTANIQQDATFGANGKAFTAVPVNSPALTDDITINIAKSKTVTVASSGFFHGNANYTPGGKYTYNIDGTLDLQTNDRVLQFTPLPDKNSVLTLNVSGVLKLPNSVNIASPSNLSGKLALNILNGGVVDATKTPSINTGLNYFTTHGSGVFKRNVRQNDELMFPVGSPGSVYPSPVLITNWGPAAIVAVSVKNQFDVSPPNSTKVVNKQWSIVPEGTGATLTIKPLFGSIDVASGFSRTAPTAIYYRPAGSTTWESKTAELTGAGSVNSPYIAAATGFNSFGVFIVQNTGASNSAMAVSLYPNPAHNEVNVDFPQTEQESTMQITNYHGRNMLVAPVKKGVSNYKHNISDWPSGIYFLKMQEGDKVSSIKFIKQ